MEKHEPIPKSYHPENNPRLKPDEDYLFRPPKHHYIPQEELDVEKGETTAAPLERPIKILSPKASSRLAGHLARELEERFPTENDSKPKLKQQTERK